MIIMFIGADSMGAIAPTAKKLWVRCLQVAPTGILSCFETVKRTLKIRIYHYGSDKSCADFSLKWIISVWRPGFAQTRWGVYSAPPDLLPRFKSGDRDTGRRKGERQDGIDSWGRGTKEGGKGQEGKRDGREWEENGSRNLAGASKGTPGDTKCVTEIIGGQK